MPAFAHLRDDARLKGAEEIINFHFADPSLLREALQAAGFITPDGNKKLAVIGDAALKLVLVMEGRARNQPRDRINKVLSTRASNSYLANDGFLEGLDRYIYNNPAQAGHIHDSLKATTMEAILGAVLLDSGSDMSVFKNFVQTLGLSWPE